MNLTFVFILVVALIAATIAWPAGSFDFDYNAPDDSNFYKAMIIKGKRSPSIGLSLAEYMAGTQGGDNFHFIPAGRK
uniref:Neuropeptide-Like Protein n=1 Tax=Rhabditophanes sp. KR3021 TaxID=114890 RepID=A0AC35U6P3_9BILA